MYDEPYRHGFWAPFLRPEVLAFNALVLALCVWRVWRFTIVPLLDPLAPKVYPYWIPIFGHLFSFMRDADGTVTKARKYFGDTREPFAFVIVGKYVYFVTSAKDMSAVFKNTSELTFDEYVQNMSLRAGMTPESVHQLWKLPSEENCKARPNAFPNPAKKCVAHLGEVIFKTQLHPGNEAEKLWASVLERIHSTITRDGLPQSISTESPKVISLRRLIYSTLVESATLTFFGKALFEVEPDILQHFDDFDESSWKLSYRVPAPWAKDMLASKKLVSTAIQKYVELPGETRTDACWMIPKLEAEFRGVGLNSRDIALQLLLLYWVANGNPWKVAFWLATRILYDPTLKEQIQQEIDAYVNANPPLAPNELAAKLETCTVLMATFHEVLRTTAGSKTARRVQGDCIIGGKRLKKGGQILIPHRQILLDKKTYGPDAEEFNAERFVQDPTLAKNPAFRPFGGGITYCPGRFLARKEILTVVSLLIGRFDVEIAGQTSRFPIMEQENPSLGIMGPKHGEDVWINVSNSARRKS